jgi:hypothetical protein
MALVRTDVSEERIASIIGLIRIGEPGTARFFIVTAVKNSNLIFLFLSLVLISVVG